MLTLNDDLNVDNFLNLVTRDISCVCDSSSIGSRSRYLTAAYVSDFP